jgi:hypothetical protein
MHIDQDRLSAAGARREDVELLERILPEFEIARDLEIARQRLVQRREHLAGARIVDVAHLHDFGRDIGRQFGHGGERHRDGRRRDKRKNEAPHEVSSWVRVSVAFAQAFLCSDTAKNAADRHHWQATEGYFSASLTALPAAAIACPASGIQPCMVRNP